MGADAIGQDARRAIVETMVAMAWADRVLTRDEVLAVQAAGKVLGLPDDALEALDAGPPKLRSGRYSRLAVSDKRLVFQCAAWLACVDANEGKPEGSLLGELREHLGLTASEASSLRDEARTLHATTPAGLRWLEELEALLVSVA